MWPQSTRGAHFKKSSCLETHRQILPASRRRALIGQWHNCHARAAPIHALGVVLRSPESAPVRHSRSAASERTPAALSTIQYPTPSTGAWNSVCAQRRSGFLTSRLPRLLAHRLLTCLTPAKHLRIGGRGNVPYTLLVRYVYAIVIHLRSTGTRPMLRVYPVLMFTDTATPTRFYTLEGPNQPHARNKTRYH